MMRCHIGRDRNDQAGAWLGLGRWVVHLQLRRGWEGLGLALYPWRGDDMPRRMGATFELQGGWCSLQLDVIRGAGTDSEWRLMQELGDVPSDAACDGCGSRRSVEQVTSSGGAAQICQRCRFEDREPPPGPWS